MIKSINIFDILKSIKVLNCDIYSNYVCAVIIENKICNSINTFMITVMIIDELYIFNDKGDNYDYIRYYDMYI